LIQEVREIGIPEGWLQGEGEHVARERGITTFKQ